MPKSPPPPAAAQQSEPGNFSGVETVGFIRKLLERLKEALTDDDIESDLEPIEILVPSGIQCQTKGIGLFITSIGDLSLISPFGMFEYIGTITLVTGDDPAAVLSSVLDDICGYYGIDYSNFSSRIELESNAAGFWICSFDEQVLDPAPRFLEPNEVNDGLMLENTWQELVGE